MNNESIVDVGTRLILRLALIVVGVYFLYLVRDVVLVVFLSVLTSSALSPVITMLTKKRIPRTGAVIITYIGLLTLFVAFIGFFIPVFVSEIRDFAENWTVYSDHLSVFLSGAEQYTKTFGLTFNKASLLQNAGGSVAGGFSGIFSTTIGVFSTLVSFLGFFFLSLYFSIEENGIEKFFLAIAPERYHEWSLSLARRIRERVSRWLAAQLFLMFILFVIYYIGLSLLGIPYALAIALFGGLMELIPYIGPVVSAIPALILAFLASPSLGFITLVFYVITHQLEGHVLAPQVMKHSAGLNPVVLIIAVLIGFKLGGSVGVLLAGPTAMVLGVFVEDFLEKKQTNGKQ